MTCPTCHKPIERAVQYCPSCYEPTGVVLYDADADRLIEPTSFRVEHEGRARVLRLRVGRGDIRDEGR